MQAFSRGAGERAQAWLVTGPLGHLWSAVADLAAFVWDELRRKARRG